jgi:FixJ family two-component response regulator
MPGMNGRRLADELLSKWPALKVVFISGYTDSFIAGHGVLEPGTHLLHKPFTEDALIRKVREVLDTNRVGAQRQKTDQPVTPVPAIQKV